MLVCFMCSSKLYSLSTVNTDLIIWQQFIVGLQWNIKSWFKSWIIFSLCKFVGNIQSELNWKFRIKFRIAKVYNFGLRKLSPAKQLLIQQVGLVNSRHFYQHSSCTKHWYKILKILYLIRFQGFLDIQSYLPETSRRLFNCTNGCGEQLFSNVYSTWDV